MKIETLKFIAQAIDAYRCSNLPEITAKAEALQWISTQFDSPPSEDTEDSDDENIENKS